MGTKIHLIAKGEDFSPELWERIYEESLVLLENFPARLMRLKTEKAGGRKRYTYSPDIVSSRYKPDEHWTVSGDMSSLQRAEAFELYRHHTRQFPDEGSFSRPANSHDVLWRDPGRDLDSVFGNGRLLWDSKTQGCPYHFALLAVGMLVEGRCSHGAYVTGDIDREQAEQVASWANAVLEEPIDLPVCVDPERLYRRVFELYGDDRLAMRRSSAVFLGARDESTTDSSPTGEHFLLKEIADQTPRYPEEERMARTTGEALRNRLLSSSVLAQITSGDALLPALYRVTRENEIVLTARSWETIESLEDEEVLKHLLALAYVGERELHFCDWRRYILEHPRLWNVLTGRRDYRREESLSEDSDGLGRKNVSWDP